MSMTREEYDSVEPMSPEYWALVRGVKREPWPEHDPKPEVSTRDPRPADAPKEPLAIRKLVALATGAGIEVRVGYSRGLQRGQKTSTYRMVEVFSVWFDPTHESGYRPQAMYRRFVDAKETFVYDSRTERIEPDPSIDAAGKGGPWQWRISVAGRGAHHFGLSVTHLIEFVELRGRVLPSWFTGKTTAPTEEEE